MQIFYFTGTGNSLSIAKKIKDNFDDTELIPIKKDTKYNINESTIGIIFPTYFWDAPQFIVDFINNNSFPKDSYYFAIATCNASPGNNINTIYNTLKKKNINLNFGISLDMPGNAILSDDDTNKKRLSEVDKYIEQISKSIKNKENNMTQCKNKISNSIISSIMKIYGNNLEFNPNKFCVSNNCIGCHICENICPTKNIQIVENKPIWNTNCVHCLACFHWCPKEAISMNNKVIKNRKKYHNPDITLKELISQNNF